MKLNDIDLNECLQDAIDNDISLSKLIKKIEKKGYELDMTYLYNRVDGKGFFEDNYYCCFDNDDNLIKEIDLVIIYDDLSDAYQKKAEINEYYIEKKGIDY